MQNTKKAVTDSRTVAGDKYLADSCGKNNAVKDESVAAGFKSAFQYDLETQQLQAELDTLASAKKDFDKTDSRTVASEWFKRYVLCDIVHRFNQLNQLHAKRNRGEYVGQHLDALADTMHALTQIYKTL